MASPSISRPGVSINARRPSRRARVAARDSLPHAGSSDGGDRAATVEGADGSTHESAVAPYNEGVHHEADDTALDDEADVQWPTGERSQSASSFADAPPRAARGTRALIKCARGLACPGGFNGVNAPWGTVYSRGEGSQSRVRVPLLHLSPAMTKTTTAARSKATTIIAAVFEGASNSRHRATACRLSARRRAGEHRGALGRDRLRPRAPPAFTRQSRRFPRSTRLVRPSSRPSRTPAVGARTARLSTRRHCPRGVVQVRRPTLRRAALGP